LVVEDFAEVILVGENVVLFWQEGTSRINQVDTRKIILKSDFLRSNVLLHRDWVVCSALVSVVVGDDHAPPAVHHSHAGKDISTWDFIVKASQL